MASKTKGRNPLMRVLPVALKVFALCAIAVVALLLLLPAPPERSSGGVTTIAKHVPRLRDTVNPLGSRPDEASNREERIVAPPPVPSVTPEPETPRPLVITAPPPLEVPPAPLRKPVNDVVAVLPSTATEVPSVPRADERVARLPDESANATPRIIGTDPPSRGDIQDWLKSQAWEFLGGVDPQGNILYRFEVWLDAPRDVLNGIKSVSYVYDAPSATPEQRESDDSKSGFRARFGSLACSKKVTVVVTMADGSRQQAVADGCRALN